MFVGAEARSSFCIVPAATCQNCPTTGHPEVLANQLQQGPKLIGQVAVAIASYLLQKKQSDAQSNG
jgi:hypothetical protein